MVGAVEGGVVLGTVEVVEVVVVDEVEVVVEDVFGVVVVVLGEVVVVTTGGISHSSFFATPSL